MSISRRRRLVLAPVLLLCGLIIAVFTSLVVASSAEEEEHIVAEGARVRAAVTHTGTVKAHRTTVHVVHVAYPDGTRASDYRFGVTSPDAVRVGDVVEVAYLPGSRAHPVLLHPLASRNSSEDTWWVSIIFVAMGLCCVWGAVKVWRQPAGATVARFR